MDALKRQIMQMNLEKQNAENYHKDLTRIIRREEERATQAELEAKSLRTRIKLVNKNIEKCSEQLAEKGAQLHAKEEEADESEKLRKALEVKEYENTDDIAIHEMKVAEANRRAAESGKKHNDAVVRFNALKVELSNALARLNTSESRLIALQEETDYEYRKLLKVEYKGNCLDKRADYFEDEIERVEQKYYTALQVEDENVVLAKELTIERDRIRSQVQSWNKRVTNLRRELDDTLADINRY